MCEGLLSHNKQPTNRDIGRDLPIYFDFDPWWSNIPRNPFAFGGQFDGTSWYPAVPIDQIEIPQINIESPNPTVSAPIMLAPQFAQMETLDIGSGAGRSDLEFGVYRYREN